MKSLNPDRICQGGRRNLRIGMLQKEIV